MRIPFPYGAVQFIPADTQHIDGIFKRNIHESLDLLSYLRSIYFLAQSMLYNNQVDNSG
jgi:hypothetical protein